MFYSTGLLTTVRLHWKGLSVTNTLAYFVGGSVTKKKPLVNIFLRSQWSGSHWTSWTGRSASPTSPTTASTTSSTCPDHFPKKSIPQGNTNFKWCRVFWSKTILPTDVSSTVVLHTAVGVSAKCLPTKWYSYQKNYIDQTPFYQMTWSLVAPTKQRFAKCLSTKFQHGHYPSQPNIVVAKCLSTKWHGHYLHQQNIVLDKCLLIKWHFHQLHLLCWSNVCQPNVMVSTCVDQT